MKRATNREKNIRSESIEVPFIGPISCIRLLCSSTVSLEAKIHTNQTVRAAFFQLFVGTFFQDRAIRKNNFLKSCFK